MRTDGIALLVTAAGSVGMTLLLTFVPRLRRSIDSRRRRLANGHAIPRATPALGRAPLQVKFPFDGYSPVDGRPNPHGWCGNCGVFRSLRAPMASLSVDGWRVCATCGTWLKFRVPGGRGTR